MKVNVFKRVRDIIFGKPNDTNHKTHITDKRVTPDTTPTRHQPKYCIGSDWGVYRRTY